MHECGIGVSHETVRFWWLRFGPMFAAENRKRRIEGLRSSRRQWRLGEMFMKISGETHYLWRALDHEGESRVKYAGLISVAFSSSGIRTDRLAQ